MSKVYFITGASSGFGRAMAEAVLERGERAVLAVRKIEDAAQLIQQYQDRALGVRLDVTNENERRQAVQAALKRFGRVDVLANIAGQGSLGAAEEFSSEQIRRQFEVNCFAVIELTRELLSVMRKQKSGHILNLTSIGGLASVGGFALYCARKCAVEGFSEALRDEVKPLGIKVTIVEPGAFRTEFAGAANMRPQQTINDYKPIVEPIQNYLYGNDGKQPGDPKKAAGTSNIDQERARNRRIVEDFFSRLEAMDIRGFVSLFDEAGVQEMPYSPAGFPKELRGRAAIEKQYGGLPQSYNSMRFINRVWYETVDPAVFVVSYKGVIDVKNGKPYNNDYVGIWQLRDGKIIRYREHFNQIILREAFGKNLDKNFNVN